MKKFLYALVILFAPFHLHAQITGEYRDMIKKAEAYCNNKQYQKSAETYQAALRSGNHIAMISDIYNASAAMAQAGMIDSAFFWLNMIGKGGNITGYDELMNDINLLALHNDARWKKLSDKVKESIAKKAKEEANYNRALIAILDTIHTDDQKIRRKIKVAREQYPRDSKEMQILLADMHEKDSINLVKVEQILTQYGWLGRDVIGWTGNNTLFLVIQHADLSTQLKYLPMLKEAVNKDNARASQLALLEDRVALRQGRKQIYGSQIAVRDDGVSYLQPLEDPDNVDKRRAEVGLPPLAVYMKHYDLEWDLEAFKKQQQEADRKRKQNSGK